MIKKSPKADLRSMHPIYIQLGIICSLLFMIAATNIELKHEVKEEVKGCTFPDPPLIIDLPEQIPPKVPPAPLRPSVFIELPPDTPIEPVPIYFDPIEFNGFIPAPPPIIPDTPFDLMPEIMPEMKGGISKLYSEISYPKQAKLVGIEGRVTVEFIVNKKGEVENPRILRGIGGGCDEEVLRAIKLMKFSPGIQNGNFVRVKMAQSVTFRLQN